MRRLLLLSSLLLTCHAALAQATPPPPTTPPPTPPPAAKEPPPVDQTALRAQSMRQQIGEGKQVKSHVRVRVRLTNGNRITGVVKDGRLVERIDGLRFVEANAADKGAGVRIWYTSGARDFVFVPFREFAEYEIVQKLSHAQLQQVEAELQASLNQRVAPAPAGEGRPDGEPAGETGGGDPVDDGAPTPAAPDAAGQAPAGDAGGAAPDVGKDAKKDARKEAKKDAKKGPEADAAKGASADKAQQKSWFDLVQTYPPDDGWGAARRDEIKRRFVVIGTKPSAFEQRFVDEFDAWQKACAYFGVEPSKDGAAAPTSAGSGKAKDDRKSRRGKGNDASAGDGK